MRDHMIDLVAETIEPRRVTVAHNGGLPVGAHAATRVPLPKVRGPLAPRFRVPARRRMAPLSVVREGLMRVAKAARHEARAPGRMAVLHTVILARAARRPRA